MFPEANILEVDLANEIISNKKLSGEVYRLYPGGSALGLYLILQEMEPNVDPLSENNILVFSVSPLTGLPVSGTSRVVVTTKSPLTGAIGDSQAGGYFPSYLKANGWDAVVFKGKAKRPVYLFIDSNRIILKSAEHLWGRVTGETERIIREENGDKELEVAQIGPAGENLVKYACIINMCSRANGRTGTGAVMGSKKLKAIVVKKADPLLPTNETDFSALTNNVNERIKFNPVLQGLRKNGTAGDLEYYNEEGFLPTKNWTTGWFPRGAKNITGAVMTDSILIKRDTCFGCAIRCKRVVEIPEKVDPLYGGPEYETCAALGSYCGINCLETIALANQLCNMYGIDTISCGGVISFAMECYEKGLIDKNYTGGLELNFGNKHIIPILIEQIAKRQGFGEVLAEGSMYLAKKLGRGADALSMSVKNQELPAHMPHGKPGVGLIYAVNPFGPDHQSSEHDSSLAMPPDSLERRRLAQIGVLKSHYDTLSLDDDKVRFAYDSQCFYSLLDTLCLCQFVWGPSWQLYGPDELLVLCKSGIGWETSLFELMRAGERRINMMRYFNAREGFSRKQDVLPKRMFEPLSDGPSRGVCLDEKEFLNATNTYYQFAGWDMVTGNPTESTMKKLSISWLLNESKMSTDEYTPSIPKKGTRKRIKPLSGG